MKTARMEVHDIALSFEAPRIRTKDPKIVQTKNIKARELELFARTLSALLEGGVPILMALQGLERTASGTFKKMLSEVEKSVQRGTAFSEALKRTGGVPVYFYQTVHGGEISGHISTVLAELAAYIRKEQSLKRSVRNALIYPCFIVAVGFITMSVLICYVLPKLSGVYSEFGAKLPLITVMVLSINKLFLPLVVILAASGFLSFSTLKKDDRLILLFHRTKFVGPFFQSFTRVRFSRLLSLLLESGTPVLGALDVVKNAFSEKFIQSDILHLRECLARGRGFSEGLEPIIWMDPVSRMLVLSGEDTGHLSLALSQIARDTESALEDRLSVIVKMIEPALILIIGFCVGFIVIGTMLPVLDMSALAR